MDFVRDFNFTEKMPETSLWFVFNGQRILVCENEGRISMVLKGNQILLARSRRFPGGFYSVLAGYLEPGETLEECVRREVFEEVGIEVKNIQYFGSQPWPFPDSQMIAFTADYSSGDIKSDESEIVDAGWFSPDNLPEIPGKISIARRLIDWFLENRKSII